MACRYKFSHRLVIRLIIPVGYYVVPQSTIQSATAILVHMFYKMVLIVVGQPVIFGTASLVGERLSRIFVSIDITEVAQSHGRTRRRRSETSMAMQEINCTY